MGLKKKKNVIILTVCMVLCFILYQLYFFLTITSDASDRNRVIPVFDHEKINSNYVRSEDDKFINSEGIIKGVFYSQMPNYRPDSNNEFKCLKSEQRIPFENVNDDYCDCEDGTDEPSGSACADGVFYCEWQPGPGRGARAAAAAGARAVPAGRVNDGVCDCCDGSDEWRRPPGALLLSQANHKHYRFYVDQCPNNCKEK